MIFISHNYKDKDFIGPMAQSLRAKYGKDKIFFDSWSIKPGDNIIGQMNTGIEECKVFFFFITENSLDSDMVKLEWTSALMKQAKNPEMKFIPIRADNVNVPDIISSISYLDLFNNGLNVTLTQMLEVIDNEQNDIVFPPYVNLKSYLIVSGNKMNFYIYVEKFFEPSSVFIITTDVGEKDLNIKLPNQTMFEKEFIQQGAEFDGKIYNAFKLATHSGVKKGFKINIEIEFLSGNPKDIALFHAKTENVIELIPVKKVDNIDHVIT